MAIKEIEYKGSRYPISYLQLGSGDRVILFLHGWGSNKEIMKGSFGKYLSGFKHIYIDMPGFGQSPNENFLKTEDYANILANFLEALNLEAKVIAGHSFGGKVATLMKPNNLVLLSSAGILVPKPFKVRAKIALFKLLKPFGFSKLRSLFVADDAKEMNAGMYETFKYVVNEDFEHNFSKFNGKALLFWGKEDTATPLWTAKKIQEHIKDSKLYPLDGDHFFFVNHSKFIAQTIEQEVN